MTVKEQCLEIIQDILDKTNNKHAVAALKEAQVTIRITVDEPVAAPLNDYVPWRMPVQPDIPYVTTFTDIPDPCKNCPTHPSNGGSGICNCTLGLPNVTC